MHRVKGLEFDRVVVAGVTQDSVPWKKRLQLTEDEGVRREAEQQERALLYVALTRARRGVLVTGVGKLSPWVASSGADG